MADGRDEAPTYSNQRVYLWTDIFRCFQVALDPRKLLVAAVGILAMSLGWYVLSTIFWYPAPDRKSAEYDNKTINTDENKPEAVLTEENDRRFQRDFAQWKILDDLAGKPTEQSLTLPDGTSIKVTVPGGRLRTMPWNEYRGPNPYLLLSTVLSGNPAERSAAFSGFFSGTVPVLVEPLAKLFLPVVKFTDANASPQTRIYLLLCLLWSLAVWALFGGIITRIAAVQLTGKDRIRLTEAIQFVVARYTSYLLSPIVPLGIIAFIVVGMSLYGMVAIIPIVGDFLLYGLFLPLVLLGGLVMAVLVVGLVGYPLMYTTISTEGSDTFDALSRAYNYVFQAPWHYLWYSFVAVVYGAAVTLFVVFVASLTVYLSKWAISQAPLNERFNRKPDYLYSHAPTSFGWQELFVKGSPLQQQEMIVKNAAGNPRSVYFDESPKVAEDYRKSLLGIETASAGIAGFWLTIAFMLMLGFSYSYFWSASTMIYLLMRKKVDETELDEIYIEEELPAAPLPPSEPVKSAPGVTSLPTVPASPPPVPVSPQPTLPFAGTPAPVSPPPIPVSPPPAPPELESVKAPEPEKKPEPEKTSDSE